MVKQFKILEILIPISFQFQRKNPFQVLDRKSKLFLSEFTLLILKITKISITKLFSRKREL